MGMSFAYFIFEGKFFVTEKSRYGAVYQVLMMHDLACSSPRSSYPSSLVFFLSIFFLFSFIFIIIIIIEYTQIDILAINHPSFVIP